MTKRQIERITRALSAYGEAQFECGEWNRDDSDERYDTVLARANRAEDRLRKAIGLPSRAEERAALERAAAEYAEPPTQERSVEHAV